MKAVSGRPHTTSASAGVAAGESICAPAVAALRASLREPTRPFDSTWCACGVDGDTLDLNALLPLISAWNILEANTAAALARAALDTLAADGQAIRLVPPGSDLSKGPAPWPLLARAVWNAGAQAVAETAPDLAVEALRSYLGWAVRYFDPEGSGQPRWPTPNEAFIPDTWDEHLYPVDLAVFLRAEFEAFDAIQAELGLEAEDDPRVPRSYRERLSRHLLDFLWDPKLRRFSDRYRDGHRISRVTLSAVLPLFISDLPAAMLEAVRGLLRPDSPLFAPGGLALWGAWPDDPEPPPTPVLQQAIVVDALHAPGLAPEKNAVSRALQPILATNSSANPPPNTPLPDPVAAALAVVLELRGSPSRNTAQGWVRWLDRNTRIILWSLSAAFLLLGATLVILPRFFPLSGEGPAIETLAGLAQSHYTNGRYEEAAQLYEKILVQQRLPIAVFRHGNVLFRQERWEEAEILFREAMDHPPVRVQARFNLAQSLIRQGKTEEALGHLEEIIQRDGDAYPEVARVASQTRRLLNVGHPPQP